MIIHRPRITFINDQVEFSAEISFDKTLENRPSKAWLRYPAEYAPYLSDRLDAFAVSLLPLAMVLNETMVLEGAISPRLLWGLTEYQKAFTAWYPEQFSLIQIRSDEISPLSETMFGKSTAALFSGGVDSCFTLMSHLPDQQPDERFQIKYAFFVHGFDIPLQDLTDFKETAAVFEKQLNPLGVKLITCQTNLHYFSTGFIKWDIAHGAPAIGVGLGLDKLVSHWLVPSSWHISDCEPWGSAPILDYWLSSESFQAIEHGTPYSRFERTEAISNWAPAQEMLRVCTCRDKRKGVFNCSRCEKCIRTMVMLKLTGHLEKFTTFRHPFKAVHFLLWIPHFYRRIIYVPESIHYAWENKKWIYIPLLWINLGLGLIRKALDDGCPPFIKNYLKKKLYSPEKSPFNYKNDPSAE
ncbi:MAG: hypothetical protein LWX83_09320 [Anaerolineae bacterium]|nr:hypothetical protein [Anaerolineae bacterium]